MSLVTVDDPPKVHAHNLVGKDVKNGFVLIEDTKKTWIASLVSTFILFFYFSKVYF